MGHRATTDDLHSSINGGDRNAAMMMRNNSAKPGGGKRSRPMTAKVHLNGRGGMN